jgi:hypothetical protein
MSLVLSALLDTRTAEHFLAVVNTDTEETLMIGKYPDEASATAAALTIVAMNDAAWEADDGETGGAADQDDHGGEAGRGRGDLDA